MKVEWEIVWFDDQLEKNQLAEFLANGWEPFAAFGTSEEEKEYIGTGWGDTSFKIVNVNHRIVYLRRQKEVIAQ